MDYIVSIVFEMVLVVTLPSCAHSSFGHELSSFPCRRVMNLRSTAYPISPVTYRVRYSQKSLYTKLHAVFDFWVLCVHDVRWCRPFLDAGSNPFGYALIAYLFIMQQYLPHVISLKNHFSNIDVFYVKMIC